MNFFTARSWLLILGVSLTVLLTTCLYVIFARHSIDNLSGKSRAEREGKFQIPNSDVFVTFPLPPRTNRVVGPTDYGGMSIDSYVSVQDSNMYRVSVTQDPPAILGPMKRHPHEYLTGASDAKLRSNPEAKLLDRQTIMLNGSTGLDENLTLTLSVDDKSDQRAGLKVPTIVRRRYFTNHGKLYMFEVTAPQNIYDASPEAFKTNTKEFFDSIELPKEQE